MEINIDSNKESAKSFPADQISVLRARVDEAIRSASDLQLSYQFPEGYWWYTLEANETIGAEYIMLMYLFDIVDKEIEAGLIARILSKQNQNGSWSIYYGDGGDLSTTIECYFVLKLAGHNIDSNYMSKAREFILKSGGLTQSRVFTRIHLALFGLVPWSASPTMPIELILLPHWMPVNIYEFSSWARACIIPLLVIMHKKPVKKLDSFTLEELFVMESDRRDFQFRRSSSFLSWENFFIQFDKWLKLLQHIPFKPAKIKKQAIKACEKYISGHIEKTEDIFPAMSYSAMAMWALGYPLDNPTIGKALSGLSRFQHSYRDKLSSIPDSSFEKSAKVNSKICSLHQQCCVSPVWDTPWNMTALLDSGIKGSDPSLIKAGRWLISKQITENKGDWKIKNPYGQPGGWSFEFENVFFPDVDDTVQVIDVLRRLEIPGSERTEAIDRGLSWILSMQNDDGGWAAFDKNNNLDMVNKIPFSDHGACLDPSSADITARVITLLNKFGFDREEGVVKRGLNYLYKTQEGFGGWFGRWGINYIYGTWCVLTAFGQLGIGKKDDARVKKAVKWLAGIQRSDGGWSESPKSYDKRIYIPYPESTPSQTAWALMGLIAVSDKYSDPIMRGIDYLLKKLSSNGEWQEEYYTGTGFPGHFYIRYHGYRHFFPLMALGRFKRFLRHRS